MLSIGLKNILSDYFSPSTMLLPIAGLQLLIDNHKPVLFEIAKYYYYQLNSIIITGFISTALLRFKPGTPKANSCKAITTNLYQVDAAIRLRLSLSWYNATTWYNNYPQAAVGLTMCKEKRILTLENVVTCTIHHVISVTSNCNSQITIYWIYRLFTHHPKKCVVS